MKATKATTEPAAPVVKFVANTWHQAHRLGAQAIILRLENGECSLTVGTESWRPPPAHLFRPMLEEFLRYAGIRRWPWTRSVRAKTCQVEAAGTIVSWTMTSTDLSSDLTIERRSQPQ